MQLKLFKSNKFKKKLRSISYFFLQTFSATKQKQSTGNPSMSQIREQKPNYNGSNQNKQ